MILQIYRDSLLHGQEQEFRALEEEAARMCADLNCPHPHLAIESLSGPKEVWWLNAYESDADIERVRAAYASNDKLMAALGSILKRREGVVGSPVDVFATYRADLSGGTQWAIAGARFLVVTLTRGLAKLAGSVFESPDGTRFVFRPVRTQQEADALAAAAGEGTVVFAVRPYWGMPAADWIAADREFWLANPLSQR